MIKTTTLAMVAGVLLGLTPAYALTCDEFLAKTQAADKADLLPDFDVNPQQGLPRGYMEISNLKNIETGMQCTDGRFQNFGATLYEGAKSDRMRFAALILAITNGVAPRQKDAAKTVTDTQSRAFDDAKKNEIKIGVFTGSAEAAIDDYDISFSAMKGQIQFDISPKE